jgi:hypothetical protein
VCVKPPLLPCIKVLERPILAQPLRQFSPRLLGAIQANRNSTSESLLTFKPRVKPSKIGDRERGEVENLQLRLVFPKRLLKSFRAIVSRLRECESVGQNQFAKLLERENDEGYSKSGPLCLKLFCRSRTKLDCILQASLHRRYDLLRIISKATLFPFAIKKPA